MNRKSISYCSIHLNMTSFLPYCVGVTGFEPAIPDSQGQWGTAPLHSDSGISTILPQLFAFDSETTTKLQGFPSLWWVRRESWSIRVDDGARTRDLLSHSEAFYQLNYIHHDRPRAGSTQHPPWYRYPCCLPALGEFSVKTPSSDSTLDQPCVLLDLNQ